jgi:phosphoglycerate dehydrogenase-like enzyme
LEQLLRQTDVLVIAAPLTPETQSLIGATELAQMPTGAIVINVGRAKILDADALVAALRSGHLAGASLDVYSPEPLPSDHPLWSAPNVILTPHTSGFRQGHWDAAVALFAENLSRFERGEDLRFRVLPELGY